VCRYDLLARRDGEGAPVQVYNVVGVAPGLEGHIHILAQFGNRLPTVAGPHGVPVDKGRGAPGAIIVGLGVEVGVGAIARIRTIEAATTPAVIGIVAISRPAAQRHRAPGPARRARELRPDATPLSIGAGRGVEVARRDGRSGEEEQGDQAQNTRAFHGTIHRCNLLTGSPGISAISRRPKAAPSDCRAPMGVLSSPRNTRYSISGTG